MLRSLACLILMTACGSAPPVDHVHTGPGGSSPSSLDQWTTRLLAQRWRANPVEATSVGVHDHDDKLPDRSAGAMEARAAELGGFLRELGAITPALTRADERFDARIAGAAIRHQLLSIRRIKEWQRNPMGYVSIASSAIAGLADRAYAPAPTRLAAMTARLRGFDKLFADARTNLHDVPRLWCEIALRNAQGLSKYLEHDLPVAVSTWGTVAQEVTVQFEGARAAGVASVRKFSAWLEADLLPRANGDFRLGREAFEALLRDSEHIHETAEELRQMNEAAIARYQEQVVKVAAQIDPRATPAEVMKAITENYPPPAELLATARRYVTQARDFVVEKALLTLPSTDLPIIRETPPYARNGFASMDTPGPLETRATEAYYNITNVEPSWDDERQRQHMTYFNHPGLLGISVHEAMPGHFVQLLVRPEIPGVVRKVFTTGTFVEGWAHYAEEMMVDEGLGGGRPEIRLGQLRRALQRHARWYAAIAVHVDGRPLNEVAKRFSEIAYFAPFPAQRETERASYNPTYLYYAYGRMEIQRLRDDVRTARGVEFTLREFHDQLLRLGLPLSLAREALLGTDGS